MFTPAPQVRCSGRSLSSQPVLGRCLVGRLQGELPHLAEDIIEEMYKAAPFLSDSGRGNLRSSVTPLAAQRLRRIVQRLTDPLASRADRARVCRALGRAAYLHGMDSDTLHTILRRSAWVAWRRFARVGSEVGLSREQLDSLAEQIHSRVEEICVDTVIAYSDLADEWKDDLQVRRRRLLDILVSAAPIATMDAVAALARAAQWRLPTSVACIVLSEGWQSESRLPPALGTDVLMDIERPVPRILVPDPQGPGRRERFERGLWGTRFAVGPTVPLAEARTSLRMAEGAISLMHRGFFGTTAHVHCEDHLTTLLILRDEHMMNEFVELKTASLADFTPERRSRLLETLLSWLSNGSNTQAAAELSVHPQTVRYRMRQLKEIFGERLDNLNWRFEMALALRAHRLLSMPTAPIGVVEPTQASGMDPVGYPSSRPPP